MSTKTYEEFKGSIYLIKKKTRTKLEQFQLI